MYRQHELAIMKYAYIPVATCDLTPPELKAFENGGGNSNLVFQTERTSNYLSLRQRTRRYKRRIIN